MLKIKMPLPVFFVRMLRLVIGLTAFGIGISFMKQANLGLGPWDVLNDGLSHLIGWQLGSLSILTGALILLLWIPLGERPGIGTIFNMFLIGLVINVTLEWIPPVHVLALQILWLGLGLLIIGLGSALYLSSRLGAGPRDGLMMGIHRRTGWPIRWTRTGLELAALLSGWLLGGSVGIGTLAFAFGIGPILEGMCILIGEKELISRPKLPADIPQNQ